MERLKINVNTGIGNEIYLANGPFSLATLHASTPAVPSSGPGRGSL